MQMQEQGYDFYISLHRMITVKQLLSVYFLPCISSNNSLIA